MERRLHLVSLECFHKLFIISKNHITDSNAVHDFEATYTTQLDGQNL